MSRQAILFKRGLLFADVAVSAPLEIEIAPPGPVPLLSSKITPSTTSVPPVLS